MTDERPTGARPDELAVTLPLDGWRLDRKLAALAAMASQTGVALATLDRRPTSHRWPRNRTSRPPPPPGRTPVVPTAHVGSPLPNCGSRTYAASPAPQ